VNNCQLFVQNSSVEVLLTILNEENTVQYRHTGVVIKFVSTKNIIANGGGPGWGEDFHFLFGG
jgi:hypothetical protein